MKILSIEGGGYNLGPAIVELSPRELNQLALIVEHRAYNFFPNKRGKEVDLQPIFEEVQRLKENEAPARKIKEALAEIVNPKEKQSS